MDRLRRGDVGDRTGSDTMQHPPIGVGKRTLAQKLVAPPSSAAAEAPVQLRGAIDAAPPDDVPAVPGGLADAFDSGGSALPAPVQLRMEQSFGMDLSAVRVHEGPRARAMGALAYAQGADLHFAPGHYDPHSERGMALLGHELAHVAQHAEGRAPGPQAKGSGGDPALEAEADAMGARAARGEAARPTGSPRLIAMRETGGAIQRMIDTDAPINGTAWDAIERYLTRTLINNRKQTFTEAVEEYVATGVTGTTVVEDRWQRVNAVRGQRGQENTVLGYLREIRTTINTHKSQVPDHPNKQGIGPGRERYETIPQSARSKQVAQAMRTTLIDWMLKRYTASNQHYKHWDTDVSAKVKGRWSDQFMLGVLVLPNDEVRVSHSGFMGETQALIFQELVEDAGHVSEHHDDYNSVLGRFDQQLRRTALPTHHAIGQNKQHKDTVKYTPPGGTQEIGNPIGVCAAPQALDSLGSTTSEFPDELTGDTPLALTEVWVSANVDSKVTVHDHGNSKKQYRGNQDVPSCLTCQHQLREVMKKLTDLRRNVVNRENVRDEEDHRWQLVAAVEELREILKSKGLRDALVGTIVSGGKAVDGARFDDDLKALDQHLRDYQRGIDTQAKQRTVHPEHVEHVDKTTQPGLNTLVDAEDTTRKEHYESMTAERTLVGTMIQAPAPKERTKVPLPQSKTAKRNRRPPVMVKVDKQEWSKQLWEGAPMAKAREDRSQALDVDRTAQESTAARDEDQAVEAFVETAALEAAERALGQLLGYRARGLLTTEQGQRFARELNEHLDAHRAATTALRSMTVDSTDSTSTTIARGSVHDRHVTPRTVTPESRKKSDALNLRLARATRAIQKLLGELEQAIGQGSRAREDERDRLSEEHAEDAMAASVERQEREDDEVNREEKRRLGWGREQQQDAHLNREIARIDAPSSSQRRDQAEQDFSDRMWGLAMMLAQTYDTSIEYQLQELLREDQSVNIVGTGGQAPATDHSSDYIG